MPWGHLGAVCHEARECADELVGEATPQLLRTLRTRTALSDEALGGTLPPACRLRALHASFGDFLGGPGSLSSTPVAEEQLPVSLDRPPELPAPLPRGDGQLVGTKEWLPLNAGVQLESGAQPHEEVVEFWSLERPGARAHTVIHHGHRVHHLHDRASTAEHGEAEHGEAEHREALLHQQHAARRARLREMLRRRLPPEEPLRIPVPLLPPAPPPVLVTPAPPMPPPPMPQLVPEEPAEPDVEPSVVLGGALAIFAQAYLWGHVFVTLFKPQRRLPAGTGDLGAGGEGASPSRARSGGASPAAASPTAEGPPRAEGPGTVPVA